MELRETNFVLFALLLTSLFSLPIPSQLIFDAETQDQQRVRVWLLAHPTQFDQEKVREWLLGLSSRDDILGRGDKKLPKCCGQFSGHSLDSFFTKSLERYASYNDAKGFAQVKFHLDKLKKVRRKLEGSKISACF